MSAFTVDLDNHPGELARLCEAMASSGVNLLLRPALTIRMENLPGAAAATFRKLADAGSTWSFCCRFASPTRSSSP